MNNKLCSFFTLCFITVLPVLSKAQTDYLGSTPAIPAHPRILLLKNQEKDLLQKLAANQDLSKIKDVIIRESDVIISLPNLTKKMVGRRLLETCRESLRRLFFLSYSFRLTHDDRYLKRAESELTVVCAFDDWNPQGQFLDVGEMTMGVSIAYDWLYDNLPSDLKNIVRTAILKKGIEPSLDPKYNYWLKWTNNWQQVCNAGMTYAALAVYEDNPMLAKQIINRSIDAIKLTMAQYAPNGMFAEGYSYWAYGTDFNIMMISALQKAFGSDYGLTKMPGFLETGRYFENMVGPTGKSFNYSDSFDPFADKPDISMFWLADQTKDPSLLWNEKNYFSDKFLAKLNPYRLLPALTIWAKSVSFNNIPEPKSDVWVGQRVNPVAMMRTSWSDPNAIYVGFKTGSPSASHGHMDVGSFVMDADGVRWAMCIGAQDYTALEAKGMNIFDYSQSSQRWNVFAYTNMANNTLTVNNSFQNVKGSAVITKYSANPSFMFATSDLTPVYQGQLSKAYRGIAIVNHSYVIVQDELNAVVTETSVKWTMLAPSTCSVKILSNNTAELTQKGKKLILQVTAPANISLRTWYPNPGSFTKAYPSQEECVFIGFEVKLRNTNTTPLTVLLIPQNNKTAQKIQPVQPLENWK